MSGRLAGIVRSVWIGKSQRILKLSFSLTGVGRCVYHYYYCFELLRELCCKPPARMNSARSPSSWHRPRSYLLGSRTPDVRRSDAIPPFLDRSNRFSPKRSLSASSPM
eukprot:m.145463 g.145463  ORF g.145463 m.145463 type:complete len:108 (+) comp38422_c0_seq3:133-456(+)